MLPRCCAIRDCLLPHTLLLFADGIQLRAIYACGTLMFSLSMFFFADVDATILLTADITPRYCLLPCHFYIMMHAVPKIARGGRCAK